MKDSISTAILYLLPVLFFFEPILKEIKRSHKCHCAKVYRINRIPFASENELLTLAKDYSISDAIGLPKYDLQNVLIANLC